MKKLNKLLLSLSAVACSTGVIAPVLASCANLIHPYEGSEFTLIKSSKGYCIDGLQTKERDKVTEIVVPATIDGIPVVEISKGAFKGCSNLESITLPFIGHTANAVANAALFGYIFGDEIYEGCTAFTWQSYSTNDSYDALPTEGCGFAVPATLRHITITGDVKIPAGAFSGCLYVKDINFKAANGLSTTEIGNYAFYNCRSMKTFTIPSSIKTIGRCAFAECKRLREVIVPTSTETIKHNAFSNCKSIYKAYVPKNVTNMGKLVFENFVGLLLCEIKSVPSTWDSEWVSKNSSVVYDYNGGGFIYTKDMIVAICGSGSESYASVIQLLGDWDKEEVTIPGTVTSGGTTYPIRQLGASLFMEYTKIRTVTISENIQTLGPNCFEGCSNLTTINFPESLKTIGGYCFKGCQSLATHTENGEEKDGIYFNKVEKIGPSAFEDLLGLKQINLGSAMVEIDDAAFKNCIYLNPLRLTNGTKRELVFPKTIKTIGSEAFYNIAKVKETKVVEGMEKTISTAEGDITFEANNVNEEVTIGDSAFELAGVRDTTAGVYPDNIFFHLNLNNLPLKKFNNNVFKKCYLRSLLNFPQNITEIGDFAFYDSIPTYTKATTEMDCKLLQIPASVTKIGNYAFYDCYNCGFRFEGSKQGEAKTSQLTTIGNYAFAYCSYNPTNPSDDRTNDAYKEIYIPDTVTSCGTNCFLSNSGARTIHISTAMTRLESGTFSSCINLGADQTDDKRTLVGTGSNEHYEYSNPIEVHEGITYIGSSAFSSCNLLRAITIKGAITTLGSSAFANCTSLENGKKINDKRLNSIIFKDELESVTSFGSSIYQGCTNLVWAPFQINAGTSVKTPYSNIPSCAFAECDNLENFEILDAISAINNAAFRRCKSMTEVTGMHSVKYIYQNAFMDCKGLQYFAMPSGCHTIGDNAFANCTSLGKKGVEEDRRFVLPTDITQAWSSSSNIGMGLNPFVGWGDDQEIYFKDANIASENSTTKEITLKWGWVLKPDNVLAPTYYTCENSGSGKVHFVRVQ